MNGFSDACMLILALVAIASAVSIPTRLDIGTEPVIWSPAQHYGNDRRSAARAAVPQPAASPVAAIPPTPAGAMPRARSDRPRSPMVTAGIRN